MTPLEGLKLNADGSYDFAGSTTRDKLAEAYGMSVRQLMRALKQSGVYIGPGHRITARQVKLIFDELGLPATRGQI